MTPHYDPGLQRERTAIAWTRTGLAVLVNSAVVLRAGIQASDALLLAFGFFLLAAAGGAVGFGSWRAHHLATGGHPTTPHLLVLAAVGVTWFACVGGVAAIIADL